MSRRPSGLEKIWLPAEASAETVLTSAVLDQGEEADQVSLYVFGALATSFEVPAGVGARLLAECGLERAL